MEGLVGGKLTFMELAHHAPELDPRVTSVIETWDGLTPTAKQAASLDAICKERNIDPYLFLGVVAAAAKKYADNSSVIIAALSLPNVVRKSIEHAMEKEGFKDREALMKHAGFLPVPAGATFVNTLQTKVETNVGVNAGSIRLPSFEKTIEDD
jgi:hypothetical protein